MSVSTSTTQTRSTTVLASDGTACVVFHDGSNLVFSTASSPYTSWSTKTTIASAPGNTAYPGVAGAFIDSADTIYVVYAQATTFYPAIRQLTKSGSTWTVGSETVIASIAVDGAALHIVQEAGGTRLWVAFINRVNALLYAYYADSAYTSWTQGTTQAYTWSNGNPNPMWGIDNAKNGSTGYIVLFSHQQGPLKYQRHLTTDPATTWGTLTTTGTNYVFWNDMTGMSSAMDASGRLLVAASPGSGNDYAIRTVFYTAATDSWGTATDIGAGTSDRSPTLVTSGSDIWCFWTQYSAANSYALVYKTWSNANASWGTSSTLVTAGTNITFPSAANHSNVYVVSHTVGTASPWTVNATALVTTPEVTPTAAGRFAMVWGIDPPLSLYGLQAAGSVIATAAKMGTAVGGTSATKTTALGTAQNYGELWSEGNTAAWAAVTSIPAPTGHGFLLDTTILEGNTFNAGNWTLAIKLNVNTAFTTFTGTLVGRLYKRSSSGTYTQIGSNMSVAANLTATATVYTLTGTGFPSMAFVTGDRFYLDLWMTVTTTGGASTRTIVLSSSSHASLGIAQQVEITTPGYVFGHTGKGTGRFKMAGPLATTTAQARSVTVMDSTGRACLFFYNGTNLMFTTAPAPYTAWEAPVLVSSAPGNSGACGAVIDASDTIYVVYAQTTTLDPCVRTLTKAGTSWTVGAETVIAAIGAFGNALHIIQEAGGTRLWMAFVSSTTIYAYYADSPYTTWTQGTNQPYTSSASNPNPMWGIQNAKNGATVYVVLFTHQQGPIKYIRHLATDPGTTWGTLTTTGTNYVFWNDMTGMSSAMDASGRLLVAASPTNPDFAIRTTYYTAGTDSWAAAVDIGASTSDRYPTLVSNGTDVWCFWSAFSAANSYALVYKKWSNASGAWGSSTTLVAAGTNIAFPWAANAATTLGVSATVGTASPWSLSFTTVTLATPHTLEGAGRARFVAESVKSGMGRFRLLVDHLQASAGRVLFRAPHTLDGTGRASFTVARTLDAVGRFALALGGSATRKSAGRLALLVHASRDAAGRLALVARATRAGGGRAVLTARHTLSAPGRARLVAARTQNGWGRVALGVAHRWEGLGRFVARVAHTLPSAGRVKIVAPHTLTGTGRTVLRVAHTLRASGRAVLRAGHSLSASGRALFRAPRTMEGTGRLTLVAEHTWKAAGRLAIRTGRTLASAGRFALVVPGSATRRAMGRMALLVRRTLTGAGRFSVSVGRRLAGSGRALFRAGRTQNATGRARWAVARTLAGVGRLRLLVARRLVGGGRLVIVARRTLVASGRTTLRAGRQRTSSGRAVFVGRTTQDGAGRLRLGVAQRRASAGRAAFRATRSRLATGRFALLILGAITRPGRGRFLLRALAPRRESAGRFVVRVAALSTITVTAPRGTLTSASPAGRLVTVGPRGTLTVKEE